MSDQSDSSRALSYHARTRHSPGRYALSLGYLDWDSQPDPFRRFEGAPIVPLAMPDPAPGDASLDALGGLPARPVDATTLAQLLYDSLALSAWKEHGKARWSLRCNPSSGNLHPTEAYVLGRFGEHEGVFHYQPYLHALERRRSVRLSEHVPNDGLLIALTSIHWREAWKYGERAYRYCQHDVGHAIAAVTYAAAALGWRARVLSSAGDEALGRLLGLDQQSPIHPLELEHPDVLLELGPSPLKLRFSHDLVAAVAAAPLEGAPNVLSREHHDWPEIEQVASACSWKGSEPLAPPALVMPARVRPISARHVFRTRRSAVDMDGATPIPRETFEHMLAQLMPDRLGVSALPFEPAIDAILFVHRVEGLPPGLYALCRTSGSQVTLREWIAGELTWESASETVPLFRLVEGDARRVAELSMCGQAIAADGAFAVAFVSGLESVVRREGAWAYRRVHWEAGALGHVLYLEAEAAGVRATGIGCFFDDVVREVVGGDERIVPVYGFTVGGPVDDSRLRTLDAYAHLR